MEIVAQIQAKGTVYKGDGSDCSMIGTAHLNDLFMVFTYGYLATSPMLVLAMSTSNVII